MSGEHIAREQSPQLLLSQSAVTIQISKKEDDAMGVVRAFFLVFQVINLYIIFKFNKYTQIDTIFKLILAMTIFSLRKMCIFHKQWLSENILFWCYFFFKF